LAGGFLALTASFELALALAVLAAGAGGWAHAALLAGWATLAGALGLGYLRSRRRWTADRLDLTHPLVPRPVRPPARPAQSPAALRNDDEDRALGRYLTPSRQLDERDAWLRAVVPRGWFLVGMLGLAPAFVGGGVAAPSLAVGLGGVILAHQALRTLTEAL